MIATFYTGSILATVHKLQLQLWAESRYSRRVCGVPLLTAAPTRRHRPIHGRGAGDMRLSEIYISVGCLIEALCRCRYTTSSPRTRPASGNSSCLLTTCGRARCWLDVPCFFFCISSVRVMLLQLYIFHSNMPIIFNASRVGGAC